MNFHDCEYDRIVDTEFFIDGKDEERSEREKANFKQSPAIIAPFEPSCTPVQRDRDIVSIAEDRWKKSTD